MSQPFAGVVALAMSLLGGAGAIGGTAIAAAQSGQTETHIEPARAAVVETVALLNAPAAEAIHFVEPLPGQAVNSPFGLRRLPWEVAGRLHAGLDIDAVPGEAVRATRGGMVLRVGEDGGYGRFVELAHEGGLTSLYAHLGRAAEGLAVGEMVNTGQVIAFAGNSGTSTGAHLHFEVRHEGRPLNPGAFIGKTFANADALPLRTAGRIPRGVRVAYVSEIPAAKKAQMLARLEDEKAEEAERAPAPTKTASVKAAERAPSALDAAESASAIVLPPAPAPSAGRVRGVIPAAG